MVLFANSGYPANDNTCSKGFEALKQRVGLEPEQIAGAAQEDLTAIMRVGGIMPELRARRLQEIALRVVRRYGGDLGAVLKRPVADARKELKGFPTIGDPGADKILLFTKTAAIPAVPSNCVHVPLRLGFGEDKKSYSASYRSAQEAIGSELPKTCDALLRAYLLLQHHGQETCKRTRPHCDACPVTTDCRYFQAIH